MRIVITILAVACASCSDPRVLGAPCDAGDCGASVHPPGIADPSSPGFHVNLLRASNWDFPACQGCHGSDFRGGTSGVSCYQCHAQAPTACATCHGTGPTTNAHPAHAAAEFTCDNCHIVPTSWDQDGHILHDGVAITAPAKVTFGPLAQATLVPADRAGPASWDGTTCTNVYCHGAVLHDGGGTTTAPQWTDTTPPGCTGCHGDPPPTPSHARTDCATCHPPSAGHITGTVAVGRVPGCSGCHGGTQSAAPPVDLSGNTFTTALGVGAHQAHLQAQAQISAPIVCTACHAVPATIDAPGHINQPLPVVNANLTWNRTMQTCASSYCHLASEPVWTSQGEVYCGSCHEIPPSDAPHTASMTLQSCNACHPGTVDPYGNIIVTNGSSEHIDGIVEYQ